MISFMPTSDSTELASSNSGTPQNGTSAFGRLIVAGEVFDELLSNSRTTLIGIIEVEEHIKESGESSLIVNTVVDVETLVLGADEGIADVLRNLIDRHGDTVNIGLDTLKDLQLFLAVFIDFIAVEVGIASGLQLSHRDTGRVLHEVEDIDSEGGSDDSTGNDHNEEERKQSSGDDRHKLSEEVDDRMPFLFRFS